MCGHTVFRKKGEMIGKELMIQTGDPGEPPTPYTMRKQGGIWAEAQADSGV